MTPYDTRQSVDYSPLLVHFTKNTRMNRADRVGPQHPLEPFKQSTALDRLLSILTKRRIIASPMPFLAGDSNAVCFTECVWESLTEIAEAQYSPYGVVFNKKAIFDRGGGPALYVRGDLFKAHDAAIPKEVLPFVVPFDPEAVIKPEVPQDWVHEREWRLPVDFTFDYSDIQYVIVKTLDDARVVLQTIGSQNLLEDRLIPTDVHTAIKSAWSGGYHG